MRNIRRKVQSSSKRGARSALRSDTDNRAESASSSELPTETRGPSMKAHCPKCGWETRELSDDEVELVKDGRLRCGGKCNDASVPNQPSTFPPKLVMEGGEESADDSKNRS